VCCCGKPKLRNDVDKSHYKFSNINIYEYVYKYLKKQVRSLQVFPVTRRFRETGRDGQTDGRLAVKYVDTLPWHASRVSYFCLA
jgi:hypothetical protein